MLRAPLSDEGGVRGNVLAVAATWFVFTAAVVPQLEPVTVSGVALGGAAGLVLVTVGFAAAADCRPRPRHSSVRQVQLATFALGAGVVLGLIILGAQLALATIDRGLHAQLARFAGESLRQPLIRAFSAAGFEEVVARLFAMSGLAWLATRFGRADQAFQVALWGSAIVFALGHFPDPSLTGLMVLVLNGAGGLLLGWLFWRWGLPYAILCHFAAGMIIQGFGPRLVG